MVSVDVISTMLTYLLRCRGGNKEATARPGQKKKHNIVQELCGSRGGRPELSVLTSLLVSVDVKLY